MKLTNIVCGDNGPRNKFKFVLKLLIVKGSSTIQTEEQEKNQVEQVIEKLWYFYHVKIEKGLTDWL